MQQKYAVWQNADFLMLKQVVHSYHFYILLYGCKTWLLLLWEKHRLEVFGNGVLRKRPKRGWVGGGYRRLGKIAWWTSSSVFITNVFRWSHLGGQDGQGMWHAWGEKRNVYRALVGKPEGKWPLGRSRHRLQDEIIMDLRETGMECMEWINLAEVRDKWWALVSTLLNFWVHKLQEIYGPPKELLGF